MNEEVSEISYEGTLKFYKDKQKFGFLLNDVGEEIFLHKDNLVKSRIDSHLFEICSRYFDIKLRYHTLAYKRRNNPKVKAINIKITNFIPKVDIDKCD